MYQFTVQPNKVVLYSQGWSAAPILPSILLTHPLTEHLKDPILFCRHLCDKQIAFPGTALHLLTYQTH